MATLGNNSSVIQLRPKSETIAAKPSWPFDQLTARIVMQRHAAGTLDPGIVAALLLAAGLQP
jgi:hypothetical protein